MIVDRLVLLLVVSVTWSKNWKAASVRSKKLKAWGGGVRARRRRRVYIN